jgi:membrane protease YdiL (CAAX protease family)
VPTFNSVRTELRFRRAAERHGAERTRKLKGNNILPALVGLTVAWGGTALLLSPADRLLGRPDQLRTKVLEQLVLWVLLVMTFAIVALWEKQPLASMGIRPLRWSSPAWGLGLATVTILAVMPSLTWALRAVGIPGFEAGMAKILVLPVWYRIVAVVTAGIVEDTLLVGYAFTRLTRITGSQWLAGGIAGAVFSLLHLPNWGVGPVLTYFVAVGLAMSFFAWRRDLLANIVAHTIVDGMGLVVIPALSSVR